MLPNSNRLVAAISVFAHNNTGLHLAALVHQHLATKDPAVMVSCHRHTYTPCKIPLHNYSDVKGLS